MKRILSILIATVAAMGLVACGGSDDYMPKPRGYFRIDLPEKSYQSVDTIERYRFECPQYAFVTHDPYSPYEKNWANVEMPVFKASIHLTHKEVDGNLGEYLEDFHTMLTKHIQKANGMRDNLIINEANHVYGMLVELDGKGVATPLQFYLTDSVHNYVRGALYFNFKPNNDSVQPVIDYIREDIDQMIASFEWK